MALVIQDTPPGYASMHDDLIYTVSETTKTADPETYPNYAFLADVYVGGVMVARLKRVQDPVTAIGVFNIGQVIRNYIACVFDPAAGLVSQTLGDGEFFLTVQVKFGEEYDFVKYPDITVDSTRVFFNHYNGRQRGTNSILAAVTNEVASARPVTTEILFSTGVNLLPYFPIDTSPVSVTVTPVGGGSVYNTTITPANAYDLQILNLSPGAINNVAPGTITAATKYYTVAIGSQTYRFNIVCEAIYTPYHVHFLNRYGGFETKIFQKVSRTEYEIQKKDFGIQPFRVDGSGQTSYRTSNGVYYENRSVYSSQQKEKMTLNTDILTDAEYGWLRDLLFSPMVYLEDAGFYYPVVVAESNYEPKKTVNDDLTNLTIKIEFGNQLNAQYR